MSQALRDRLVQSSTRLSEVLADEATVPRQLVAQLQGIFMSVVGATGIEAMLPAPSASEDLMSLYYGNGAKTPQHELYRADLRHAGSTFGEMVFFGIGPFSDEDRTIVDACMPFVSYALSRLMLHGSAEALAHDDHTSLARLTSRDVFVDRLTHALARANRHFHSLGVISVWLTNPPDNGIQGKDAQDAILRTIARRMIRAIRTTDSVGRIADMAFAVLLEDVDDQLAVEHIVEKIRAAVEGPVRWNRKPLHVEASIGWSIAPRDGTDAITLMERAGLTQRVAT